MSPERSRGEVTPERTVHTAAEIRLISAFYRVGSVKGAAALVGVSEQRAKNTFSQARHRARVASNSELVERYWKAIADEAEFGVNKRMLRYRFDEEYRERVKKQARDGMRKKRAAEAEGLRQHYDRLLATQGNVCAVCGQAEGKRRRGAYDHFVRLAVDHDHATGAIRELLCATCNLMLGCAKDDPLRLENGAAYLRRHAQRTSHNHDPAVA